MYPQDVMSEQFILWTTHSNNFLHHSIRVRRSSIPTWWTFSLGMLQKNTKNWWRIKVLTHNSSKSANALKPKQPFKPKAIEIAPMTTLPMSSSELIDPNGVHQPLLFQRKMELYVSSPTFAKWTKGSNDNRIRFQKSKLTSQTRRFQVRYTTRSKYGILPYRVKRLRKGALHHYNTMGQIWVPATPNGTMQ